MTTMLLPPPYPHSCTCVLQPLLPLGQCAVTNELEITANISGTLPASDREVNQQLSSIATSSNILVSLMQDGDGRVQLSH